MGDIIMILSFLGTLNGSSSGPEQKVVEPARQIASIAIGMNKKELISSFGKPSWTKKEHNFYSRIDSVRYFYDNEACAFSMHSCTVDLVNGKIASYQDVKEDFLKD